MSTWWSTVKDIGMTRLYETLQSKAMPIMCQQRLSCIPMGICPPVAIKTHKGQFFHGLLVWPISMQWMGFLVLSLKRRADPPDFQGQPL